LDCGKTPARIEFPPWSKLNPLGLDRSGALLQPEGESSVAKALKITLFVCLSTLIALAGDVTGTWTYGERHAVQVWGKSEGGSAGADIITLNLKLNGSALTGAVIEPKRGDKTISVSTPISNGQVDGDHVSFDVVRETFYLGSKLRTVTHYDGIVAGDTIHFTITGGEKVDAQRQLSGGAQAAVNRPSSPPSTDVPRNEPGGRTLRLTQANSAATRTTTITAPGRGQQNLNVFYVDTRDFPDGGTLMIDIDIAGTSATDGSFDLFPGDTPITPQSQMPRALTGRYDIRKGSSTRLQYRFAHGQVFALNLQGNWFSAKGATGQVQFRASVSQ
jgi:hypothetical protein